MGFKELDHFWAVMHIISLFPSFVSRHTNLDKELEQEVVQRSSSSSLLLLSAEVSSEPERCNTN